jgi:hypothetical protein
MSSSSEPPPTSTFLKDPPFPLGQTPDATRKDVFDNPNPYLTSGVSLEETILFEVGQGGPGSEMLTLYFVKNNRVESYPAGFRKGGKIWAGSFLT